MLSPAPSPSEIRSSRCQEADSSPKGPTATHRSVVPGLRSRHLRCRWKALETLDTTEQKMADSDTGSVLTRCLKIRCAITLLHAPHAPALPLCHVSRLQDATSALDTLLPFEISLWLKMIKDDQIRKILILFVPFCKHRGHTIDRCNMRAGILQRSTALTASGSVPSSDVASFDPVSLTTPIYSIADLQALFSYVQAPSSSASNPALSVTPGISSEWFLDSACCNHMTDNPHLTSAHTPPVLPTITTADGSAMTVNHVGSISTPNLSVSDDSQTGQIVGTARKVGRLFELTSLHFSSSSVSAPVIAASASIELWHSRLDTVRALTNAASTPVSFWGEAAFTAVYTINRCPSPVIQNTTPYERLFDTAPNYSLLKVILILRLILYLISSLRFLPLSAKTVNPISDESPPTDPSSNESSIADPTFDKSPLSAPAANPVNTTALEPRRSYRVNTLPSHLHDFHCFSVFATLHEPHTFREASPDPLWQQVMKEELDALLKTGTWDLVDLSAGKSAIGCKWVYKIKTRSDGTIDRYKARLVAKGYTQEYGIDYKETFAPVARLSFVRTLIAVSASRHWPLFQMDVKNAFLNGELTEEVYMQLPPGFSQPPSFSHKVCRLRWALYGLKQTPRAWFAKFSSTISQHGFSASSYDSALFFRRSDHVIFLVLKSLHPPMVTISLKLSTHLILSLELESRTSKIVDTPIEYNNRLNTNDGEPLLDATLYRQLVGSLVYLTVTRPDISYAVHIVSQFMAAPQSLHYATVLRILRYLKDTLFYGLHFSSQSSLTLQAYSDADWAGDPTDRRSTIGYCFLLVPIHCDNRSAIQIAHNDVFHERTKHIEIDCYFVRHHLLQGYLQLRSVSSQDQLADIFTKPMPPGRFRDLISKLKLVSLHPT
uniref:Reverse transcriptase Ty1/copia-type domain-containing protein n=1 Tax=Fagus sylvatica TaxID=28930 RepID=A0A2N9GQI4_FAGSY